MRAFDRFRIRPKPGQEEGTLTVALAMAANIAVAVAKTVASVITRSSSMLAEAVHSWVDVGNELFIVFAFRSAKRPPDRLHPLGFGRESYVWSMFASLGMLVLGAAVNVWRGLVELSRDTESDAYAVGYIVLAVSFVLEGISFVQSYFQMKASGEALGRDTLEHAARTSNSPLRAVFTEDLIALIGLLLAAAAMGLHQLTGKPAYDAWGAIAIGVLMAIAAIGLINKNRQYLAGQSPSPEFRTRMIEHLKQQPGVERVTFVYAEFIGPDRLLLMAGVSIKGELDQDRLAYQLRDIERHLMQHKYIGLAFLSLATPDEEDAPLVIEEPAR